jgi:hypothetical protein
MKPEELKEIAEWMGYEAEVLSCRWVRLVVGAKRIKYDPAENADQLLEIIKRFDDFESLKDNNIYTVRLSNDADLLNYYGVDDSFEEAILKAALQAAKEES